jgi:DNA-binding IclR family transcriptional regulator
MLGILDLYGPKATVLSAEEVIARLNTSRPTGCRYVRELVAAGLLVRAAGGYSLGPRTIELDWLIRRRDPVRMTSRGSVRERAARTGCDMTQMGIYGERILTVHHEPGPEPLQINSWRGHPMPLFRGGPSRAVIAFLPRARLKRLYEGHRGELPAEARRHGFEKFAEQLQAVGHAISLGELDADKAGIAVPVLRKDRSVAGSICLVMRRVRYDTANHELLVRRPVEAANQISDALEADADARAHRRITDSSTRATLRP